MNPRPSRLEERMARLALRDADLRVTVSRSSGPGGQHVHKVSTAVQILHVPTGLAAVAGDSRSQHTNRLAALERLVEKLEARQAAAEHSRQAAAANRRRQRARRSASTKRELIEGKRRRAELKQGRKKIAF
jgi:protein subunit release factor A